MANGDPIERVIVLALENRSFDHMLGACQATPAALAPAATASKGLNDHQAALIALSHALETMAGEEASVIAARSRQVITGPQSQIDAAVERFAAFIKNRNVS